MLVGRGNSRARAWAAAAIVVPLAFACALMASGPVPNAGADTANAPFWPTGTPSLVASVGTNFVRVGGAAGWADATHTPPPFTGYYYVYRSESTITGAGGHFVGRVPTGSPKAYDDYSAIPGEDYRYSVVAVDEAGTYSLTSGQGVKYLATSSSVTVPGSQVAHNSYADNSNLCRDCHKMHGAAGPKIFRKSSEKLVCYTCHDGTGSIYDVKNGSTPQSISNFGESVIGTSTMTSYHPVPNASKVLAGDSAMECSDCHIAHKSPAANPRLLLAGGPSGETSTNAFCWVCHGTDSSANGYKMGGDHRTGYYNLAAHSAEVSLTLSAWQPASGTKINCENCHKSHGATTTRLTAVRLGSDQTEQNLCYGGSGSGSSGCHGTGATKNIYQYFDPTSMRSYHAVTGTSYDGLTGAKVECSSCHGPHTVRTSWKLTDTQNTKSLLTTASAGGNNFRTYFCNSCHKASGFPVASTGETTIVPFTIAWPTVTSFPFWPGWNKDSYYYTSGHWLQSFTAGYDTVRDCTYCHDPHGTANARLTKWSEENTCYECHKTPKPTGVGNAKDVGAEMGIAATETVLFATRGGNTNYDRYSTGGNAWAARAVNSANFSDGSAQVWEGTDYIYATVGGAQTFRRFSISGNSWQTMQTPTVTAGQGASLVKEGDYIYYVQGNNTTKFMRYDTTANTWNDAAAAEITIGATNYTVRGGGDTAHAAGSDFIYLQRGNDTTDFLRYSINDNAWATRAVLPWAPGGNAVGEGGGQLEMASDATYVYSMRGDDTAANGTVSTARYDSGANTWSDANMADLPGAAGPGGSLVWDGGSYLYALRGSATTNLYRFAIAAPGSWTNMAPTGAFTVNAGGSLSRAADTTVTTAPTVHPVATSGRHSDTETASRLNTSNRHSECVDCHDPHWTTRTGSVDATKALHPSYTATIGPALVGAWGVEPTAWPSAWTTQSAYNLIRMDSTSTRMEWQVCFRCHTYYAYGSTPPTSPSGGFAETDLSKDFNVNNASLHSVTTAGKNDWRTSGGTSYAASLISGWTPTARMACSDCHRTNKSISSTVPGGPHGSANTYILRANWDTNTGDGSGDSADLCFICHDYNTYVSGGNSNTGFARSAGNNEHTSGRHREPCSVCHGMVPHGLNRAHFITYTSDPAPYDGGNTRITSFTDRDNRNYSESDCVTSGGCH